MSGKRQNAKPPPFDGRFLSGEWLYTLIHPEFRPKDWVLRGPYTTPTAAALDDLALAMTILRRQAIVGNPHVWSAEEKTLEELRQRASNAVWELAQVLPKIKAFTSAADRNIMKTYFDQLLDLEAAVKAAADCPFLMTAEDTTMAGAGGLTFVSDAFALCGSRPIRKWHDYADWLADKFRDVVQAANPDLKRLGSAENGPVVRFLIAAIPHISGETEMTPGAVHKHLERASKHLERTEGQSPTPVCP